MHSLYMIISTSVFVE